MPDFAFASLSKVVEKAPFGGHPGVLIFDIVLSGTTYANGNLNIATLLGGLLGGYLAESVKAIDFTCLSGAAVYIPQFAPASPPTWVNLGTLKLFTATATEAVGALTVTIRAVVILA